LPALAATVNQRRISYPTDRWKNQYERNRKKKTCTPKVVGVAAIFGNPVSG
jgi:hypothetical protein